MGRRTSGRRWPITVGTCTSAERISAHGTVDAQAFDQFIEDPRAGVIVQRDSTISQAFDDDPAGELINPQHDHASDPDQHEPGEQGGGHSFQVGTCTGKCGPSCIGIGINTFPELNGIGFPSIARTVICTAWRFSSPISTPHVVMAQAGRRIIIPIATRYRARADRARMIRDASASTIATTNPCQIECTSVHPSASTIVELVSHSYPGMVYAPFISSRIFWISSSSARDAFLAASACITSFCALPPKAR